MKVLLTGGNGFIGSHVVDHLLELGHEVVIFDRANPGKPNQATDSRVSFFVGDIRDKGAVDEAVRLCDGAINLAGLLGTAEAVDDPFPAAETNIFGGLNFLTACRKYNKKGVQIAVGNHFMNNTYSISKTTVERFALMFNKEHGTKVAVVRGLNAFGERQHHAPIRKITPNLVLRALKQVPIEIYGSGNQVMDMIYVKDLARILVAALVVEHDVYDRVFEAGTGIPTTVNELAEFTNKAANNPAGINHLEMRKGETLDSVVLGNPETLAPLGIYPETLVKFEDKIGDVLEWYRSNYEWEAAQI